MGLSATCRREGKGSASVKDETCGGGGKLGAEKPPVKARDEGGVGKISLMSGLRKVQPNPARLLLLEGDQ